VVWKRGRVKGGAGEKRERNGEGEVWGDGVRLKVGKGEVLTVGTVGGLTVGKKERLRVGRGNIKGKGEGQG
jgi:hypothetical protein